MVNVFVVHAGSDYDFVKDRIEPFLLGLKTVEGEPDNAGGSSNILTLESGKASSWKADARKKIKMAHVVIVVLGENTSDPGKEDTMGWEVAQAVKLNKQIMIYNRGRYPVPSYMYSVDRFTKQNRPVAEQMTLPQIKERIDNYAKGYYNIFSPAYEKLDPQKKSEHQAELVEQYTMFQKTSEDLVARRQDVNSFYITVNSALTAIVGIVLGVVKAPANLYVVGFMCVAGIILDIAWINILTAYGTLNAAKMKVINLLEEQLPVALYDVEWRIMSDKLNNRKYVSFTSSEKRIPKLFAIIYSVIIIAIVVYAIVKL
ncbi:MAG: hypothetical protein J5535_04805 [Firmicutes bacterium]|nr:hypothetical protein [Bacillota bacterium]